MKSTPPSIEAVIHSVRGERIILASDLANIYGVKTKALNQAIKRNRDRFPPEFCFQLTGSEWKNLRSQFVTSEQQTRYCPWVFTEHGAVMAANVLTSRQAVQMSIFVVRAFIKMRQTLADSISIGAKLERLEQEINARLDSHESAIPELMRQFSEILNSPLPQNNPQKREIGFHVKDSAAVVKPKLKRAR